MQSRKLFWVVSLVLAATGFAGGSLFSHETETATETGKAIWKEVYASPSEMARRVDAVVLARVAGTRPGRVVWSENGEDALPFQVVELSVIEGLRGAAKTDRIFLERAGGTAPDGRAVNLSYDGGAFEPGATYLLFLKKQEDGPYFYQANLQARFLVTEGRLWASDPDDPVAKAFEGVPVARGIGRVREDLRFEGTGRRPVS